jgi:ribosome biogenesis GTPase
MSVDLEALGWTPAMAAAFVPLAAAGLAPARVSLEHTHIYRVMTARGERLARVAGRLRHEALSRADFPAVGDWVAIEASPGEESATRVERRIRVVLPRFSRFSRRAAGDPTEEQIVAANVNTVFIVGALDGDFNPRRIERYLVVAWDSGAAPVVVLNKADLVGDPAPFAAAVRDLAPAVPVHAVSCRAPGSLQPLREYLGHGQTAALLGSSGVGKSSIVNELIGRDLLRTRDVRVSDSRGRHTTTHRQLVVIPGGGVIIDTPGMRELQLWDTGEALQGAFADVEVHAAACRFRDCRHMEEPGCAVRAAIAAGDLPAARLASYHKLAAEQQHQLQQQDDRALIEAKRRGRIGAKALRKRLKEKGRLRP